MKKKWLAAVVAAGALLAGCGIAHPWPTVEPVSDSHVVLMVGDSLLGNTDYSLPAVMAQRGFDHVTIIDAHQNGTGPIGPVGPDADALDWMNRNLDANPDVDTVVIEYGGACATCDGVQGPLYGSDQFFRTWVDNAIAMIEAAQARGLNVMYTVSPKGIVSGSTIASGSEYRVDTADMLAYLDRIRMTPATGNPIVDWWEPVIDLNGNAQESLFYDGAWHKVRTDDMVHLDVDGSIRTATWTAKALGEMWSSTPQPPVQADRAPRAPGLVQAGDPVTLGGGLTP